MTLSTSRNMTIFGILALCAAVATALQPQFDNDPTTTVNWGALVALVFTGIIGILGKGAASTGGSVTGSGVPVVDPAPPTPAAK